MLFRSKLSGSDRRTVRFLSHCGSDRRTVGILYQNHLARIEGSSNFYLIPAWIKGPLLFSTKIIWLGSKDRQISITFWLGSKDRRNFLPKSSGLDQRTVRFLSHFGLDRRTVRILYPNHLARIEGPLDFYLIPGRIEGLSKFSTKIIWLESKDRWIFLSHSGSDRRTVGILYQNHLARIERPSDFLSHFGSDRRTVAILT